MDEGVKRPSLMDIMRARRAALQRAERESMAAAQYLQGKYERASDAAIAHGGRPQAVRGWIQRINQEVSR